VRVVRVIGGFYDDDLPDPDDEAIDSMITDARARGDIAKANARGEPYVIVVRGRE
jgi:hypothetical protein